VDRCFVGIAAYNAGQRLDRCLTELAQTTGEVHVCVFDDGSTDGTPDLITEWALRTGFARWTMLEGGCRRGVVHARRALMDRAVETACEWFCFIDSDVYATDHDWLTKFIATYRDGITGGKLLLPDGRLWGAGGKWQPNPRAPRGIEASVRGMNQPDGPEWDVSCQVPHTTTATAFMAMDLLRRGLRVDDSGGNLRSCDDTDLCMAVQFEYGEHCWYEPVAFVHDAFSHRTHAPEFLHQVHAEQQAGNEWFWRKWGTRIVERWPNIG